jgi:hypothetical protein
MTEEHYHTKDPDDRPPACYLLTYRGCKYWSCYQVRLIEWFENLFNKEGN